MKLVFLLFSFLYFFQSFTLFSQSDCDDRGLALSFFTTKHSGGVKAYNGTYANNNFIYSPNNSAYNSSPAHTIINDTSYTDPNVCTVANGKILTADNPNNIVRIGSTQSNAQAFRFAYSQNITPSNSIFNYSYLYVLEFVSNTHPADEAQKFNVYFIRQNGDTISGCLKEEYNDASSPQISGSITCNGYKSTPWQARTADLSPYIGENITVVFEIYQCALQGHSSYMYIDLGCKAYDFPNQFGCTNGGQFELKGSPNHSNYQWYGPNDPSNLISGATSSTYTINNPVAGDSYFMEFTSATGCSQKVEYVLNNDVIEIQSVSSQASCITANDGEIDIHAELNALNPVYTHVQSQISNNSGHFDNLAVGTHQIQITTDNQGCTISKDTVVEVLEDKPSFSSVSTDSTCENDSDGAINIVGQYQSHPIKYTLQPGNLTNTSGVFNNLTIGDYTLTLSSTITGCATTDSVIKVEDLRALSVGLSASFDTCKNVPLYLVDHLGGSPDSTGTFYRENKFPVLNNKLVAGELAQAGTYNFYYVIEDPNCGKDTAFLSIIVTDDCDYLGMTKQLSESFIIYPNPAKGFFNIQGLSEGSKVSLLSMDGKILELHHSAGLVDHFSVEHLVPGKYLIQIEEGGSVYLEQMTIDR